MRAILSAGALCFASLTLVACGGDGDDGGSLPAYQQVDEIRYTSFYMEPNFVNDNGIYSQLDSSIEREDIVMMDGSVMLRSQTIFGPPLDEEVETVYYLAPGYTAQRTGTPAQLTQQFASTMDVLSPTTYSYSIPSATNGQLLTYTNTLAPLDISYLTIDDLRFYTPLDTFELNQSVMPAGSTCYVNVNRRPNFSVFEVDADTTMDFDSLEQWANFQISNPADTVSWDWTASNVIRVGENNGFQGIYLTGDSRYPYPGEYPAAVEVNGDILSAVYVVEGYTENANPDIDPVACYRVNDIAADYLEDEIVTEYSNRVY